MIRTVSGMRRGIVLAAGVALALPAVLVISPATIVSASDEPGPRQEQPDPRMAVLCLVLSGRPDQCLGYLRREGG